MLCGDESSRDLERRDEHIEEGSRHGEAFGESTKSLGVVVLSRQLDVGKRRDPNRGLSAEREMTEILFEDELLKTIPNRLSGAECRLCPKMTNSVGDRDERGRKTSLVLLLAEMMEEDVFDYLLFRRSSLRQGGGATLGTLEGMCNRRNDGSDSSRSSGRCRRKSTMEEEDRNRSANARSCQLHRKDRRSLRKRDCILIKEIFL